MVTVSIETFRGLIFNVLWNLKWVISKKQLPKLVYLYRYFIRLEHCGEKFGNKSGKIRLYWTVRFRTQQLQYLLRTIITTSKRTLKRKATCGSTGTRRWALPRVRLKKRGHNAESEIAVPIELHQGFLPETILYIFELPDTVLLQVTKSNKFPCTRYDVKIGNTSVDGGFVSTTPMHIQKGFSPASNPFVNTPSLS